MNTVNTKYFYYTVSGFSPFLDHCAWWDCAIEIQFVIPAIGLKAVIYIDILALNHYYLKNLYQWFQHPDIFQTYQYNTYHTSTEYYRSILFSIRVGKHPWFCKHALKWIDLMFTLKHTSQTDLFLYFYPKLIPLG